MNAIQNKTWALILFLLLNTSYSFSQISFDLTLKDSTYDNVIHSAVELPNGEFITVSLRKFDTGNFAASLIKLDAFGNLLKKNIIYPNGSYGGFFDIVKQNENRFILCGPSHSGNTDFLWICAIDSSLNMIEERYFTLDSNSLFYSKIKIDQQNNILVFGTVKTVDSYSHSFIFKFTLSFDSLTCHIYYTKYAYGQDLIEKSDHNGYYFLVSDYGGGSLKILEIDKALNIGKVTEITDEIVNHGNIKLVDSAHFIICGMRVGPNNMEIGVQSYDTNYHILHYNFYGKTDTNEFPGLSRSLDFRVGSSIFIGGTCNMGFYEFEQMDDWYRLNCIDTAFNLKWERFFGGDGYYTLYGILATHDGGCLMYGTFWDWHNTSEYQRYIRLIKVSKDGFLSDKNGAPDELTKEVILYPNPGKDRITVESALKNLSISMYDAMGHEVLRKPVHSSKESIDVSALSAGIYLYRFTSGEKVVDTGKWIKF